MCTAHSFTVSCSILGGSAQPPSTLEADPPPEAEHPGGRPPDAESPHADSLGGRPPPPVNWIIHRCRNITLAQTSFASCKNSDYLLTLLN